VAKRASVASEDQVRFAPGEPGEFKDSPGHDCETRSTPSARSQFRCLRTAPLHSDMGCCSTKFLPSTTVSFRDCYQTSIHAEVCPGGPFTPRRCQVNTQDRLVVVDWFSAMGDLVLSGRRLIRLSAHIPQLEMISAHYLHF
jgi:hypothetical protein